MHGQEAKKRDLTKPILFWTLAACIALVIILTNIHLTVYDKSLYKSEFTKLDSYSRRDNADYLLDNMIQFFSYSQELDARFYTQKEISHMLDVRQFLAALDILFYILLAAGAAIIIILYVYFTKDLIDYVRILRNSTIISICIAAFIVLLSLNFDWLFVVFHGMFFRSGTWVFPDSSTLISLFPFQFFYDFFVSVIFRICLISAIVFACASGFIFFLKRQKH